MATKNRRVGEELKARREELGISLHKVEVATKIRGRYLHAIEASDFNSLPNDIYSKGFVRQYASYLGLSAKELVARYVAERGGAKSTQDQQVKPRPLALRLGVTSRWVASLVILGALALIIGYLIWQFSSLTAAPNLDLETPAKDMVVDSASIEVKGTTAAGADVFVNDSPLPSDVNGAFKTTLVLQPGVNEVRVRAQNKLGKQTVITRNVLSKQAKVETLPTAPYDGISVLISAQDASTVTIVVDGEEIYKGVLAKGSTRLIAGKETAIVTSDKPSVLSAKLTNSVAAGVDFGNLGSAKSVEFTKTTTLSQ